MKNSKLLLLMVFTMLLKVSAQNESETTFSLQPTFHRYVKTNRPDKHPLKGGNWGRWNGYDHASVGFSF